MNQALAEAGDTAKSLAGLFQNGWRSELEKYQSIDGYLVKQIASQPLEKVFQDEKFSFKNIYVPLMAQLLDNNGKQDREKRPVDLETWAKAVLQDPNKQDKVMFIQGEPGRGKSVFCRMFADWVRQNLHPIWTPVLIRLRDVRVLEKQFQNTLKAAVKADFVASDDGWLTDKNTRYLFLLDGFDELLMEGRTSGGLEDFLRQVGGFQRDCQQSHDMGHRVLITGRTLALQSVERHIPANFEMVKILPMDEQLQQQWFAKWSQQVGINKTTAFQQFLQDEICPVQVRELAQEPLLLYLLAAMHRDGELTVEMFANRRDAIALVSTGKILIYQKSLDWVLTEQRPEILQRELTEQDTEDLRRILTEAGLCVVQTGGEYAAISMIEERLKADYTAKALLEEARKRIGDNPLRNALAAFYLQPGKQTGSVEFAHKSFSEFLCAERLKESLENWTEPGKKGRGFSIQQDQMDWEIYDLLGYGGLTPEIVECLMELLKPSDEFRPLQLFQRLQNFYQRWYEGEFIDAYTETLPQKKSRQLHEQNILLGQRQVDVYTGLNVMILLLELHRYAQERDDLKQQVTFYPSGEPDIENGFTEKLLRIINYSDGIQIGTFNNVVGQFLGYANLSRANLRHAILIRANLIGTDFSSANLIRVNLIRANLSYANLRGTKLIRAILRQANLSGADLSGADLVRANLNHADLNNAILSGAVLAGANLISPNLSNADLSSTNLRSANLSRANLSDTKLRNTNLRNADLSGSNLRNADLSYANLSRANLSRANLENISWDNYTIWEDVRGLETAKNVPEALKQQLGLV